MSKYSSDEESSIPPNLPQKLQDDIKVDQNLKNVNPFKVAEPNNCNPEIKVNEQPKVEETKGMIKAPH